MSDSELTLRLETFPGSLQATQVGDEVSVLITGRVREISEDLVDVTRFGNRFPEYLPGARQIVIAVTAVADAGSVTDAETWQEASP